MKKFILLVLLCCLSCKEDNNHNENDFIVDTTAMAIEEYVADSVSEITTEVINEIQKELTFDEALVTTSISDLKNFIANNPFHSDIEKLNARLIDLEVDEIYYNKNTGKMPVSDKVSDSNSNISEISIKNDTSCDLIVRYSGTDSKMISIPSNETRSISIISGRYRVTASACGESYAGNENLNGNYNSSYYISTHYR
jgi:hypothetical protein